LIGFDACTRLGVVAVLYRGGRIILYHITCPDRTAEGACGAGREVGRALHDSPILTIRGGLTGWNNVLALANYGPRAEEPRRLLASAIGSTRNLVRHCLLEELETKLLARGTVQPDELPKQIRR